MRQVNRRLLPRSDRLWAPINLRLRLQAWQVLRLFSRRRLQPPSRPVCSIPRLAPAARYRPTSQDYKTRHMRLRFSRTEKLLRPDSPATPAPLTSFPPTRTSLVEISHWLATTPTAASILLLEAV